MDQKREGKRSKKRGAKPVLGVTALGRDNLPH
jgi:hypothetical protein